jgi:hypothetical protein
MLIHTICRAVKQSVTLALVAGKDSSFFSLELLQCPVMGKSSGSDGWKSAAEILRAVLPNVASAERLQESRVWEIWEAAVGRAVARKAQPSKIQRGKLFVTVGSSVYLQDMQFKKAYIRDVVNQHLGAPVVKDIFFVLGRVQDVAVRPEPPPPLRPLPSFSELKVPKLNRPELEAAFASLLDARRRRLKEKRRG